VEKLAVVVSRDHSLSVSWNIQTTRVLDYKNKAGLKQDDLRRRREEQQARE
jgi:hypothetical protein